LDGIGVTAADGKDTGARTIVEFFGMVVLPNLKRRGKFNFF
jgi:hypothetical protein